MLNPATEETIGTVAHADRSDLDEALAAAAAGFKVWRAVSAFDRCKIMRKAAAIMRERNDEIAPLMTMEQGKPLAEAKMEAMAAADVIEWFAEEAKRAYGRVIPARGPGVYQLAIKEPVGPVAAFTPWNFPINQVVRKFSAALAAGCSIIVKAPEETPAAPAQLIRAFVDAGVPAGVINLVYGVPSEISEYLIPHPVIRKISFTGSTAVGKQFRRSRPAHEARHHGTRRPCAGDRFEDADVTAPRKSCRRRSTATPDRSACRRPACWCRTSVHGIRRQVRRGRQALKVGNGMDPDSRWAAGQSAPHRGNEGLVQDAIRKGAKLETGGHRVGNKGYFYEPTVLIDVPEDARVMNEEPFGPLAPISRSRRSTR